MGRSIIKIDNYYLEWSSVVDAPVTFGMSLDEFKEYYKEQYGLNGMEELSQRLERVEEFGTSSRFYKNVDEFISHNRAGKDGKCLTVEEVIKWYCIKKEEPT